MLSLNTTNDHVYRRGYLLVDRLTPYKRQVYLCDSATETYGFGGKHPETEHAPPPPQEL